MLTQRSIRHHGKFKTVMAYRILLLLIFFTNLKLYAQPCGDTIFKYGYYSNDSIYAVYHCTTTDGGTLIIGEGYTYPEKKGLFLKLNALGAISWSIQIQGADKVNLEKAIQLKDGNYLIAGTASMSGTSKLNIFLTKADGNGNIIWQKFYGLNNHTNFNLLHLYSITETPGSEVIVSWARVGINEGIGDDGASSVIMKIDTNGSILWSKNLSTARFGFSHLAGVFESNGKISVLGLALDDLSTCVAGAGSASFVAMQLDIGSGAILLQKNFCFQLTPDLFTYIETFAQSYDAAQLLNGNFALSGIFRQSSDSTYHYKVLFDKDFTPSFSRLYLTPQNNRELSYSTVKVLSTGTTMITDLAGVQLYYALINENEHIIDQKIVSVQPDHTPMDLAHNFSLASTMSSVSPALNGKLTFVHNLTSSNRRYIELAKIHESGDTMACLGQNVSLLSFRNFPLSPTTWNWSKIEEGRIISTDAHFIAIPYTIQKEVHCEMISNCNQVLVKGQRLICPSVDSADYTAKRNPGCRQSIQWSFDPAWVRSYEVLNDSTIRLHFQNRSNVAASFPIKATLSNCPWLRDSMTVSVLPIQDLLPPDSSICNSVNVRLSPGPWFAQYLWQDGSVDSVFTAIAKGKYWVRVKDSCGGILSDTVVFSDPYIDLGKDTTICQGELFLLKANTGFISYNWSPSGFSQVDQQTIQVKITGPAVYKLVASTPDGCTAEDSINLDTYPPVTNFIIGDTTVCAFEELVLQPYFSFRSYEWNTGATTPQLLTDRAGLYSLKVTNDKGCSGKQDIVVKTITCPSYFYLPTAFTPNGDGKNDLFKPLTAGRFLHFDLYVYNRWGQPVFHTTDPSSGWDGRMAGKTQDTGVFVWRCSYQLAGEARLQVKGTVLLIR